MSYIKQNEGKQLKKRYNIGNTINIFKELRVFIAIVKSEIVSHVWMFILQIYKTYIPFNHLFLLSKMNTKLIFIEENKIRFLT